MNKPGTSKSNSNEINIVGTLNTDPDTEGFDTQAGETWIYPTNYAIREYQYNIIQQALLKNTMVSLPTGLGKTFIAAVVMYNFYRWYPTGKIIFMAPTRPLVKQQIDACYNIMAIPKEVTAELTGTKVQTYRKEIWKEKRVFFITPQVLQNDLDILTELGSKIKCLVFDEAHKAKGNHAYCEVIRKLAPQNKYFRVLGLSATPGSSINDVTGLIHNLLISHLEIRTDDSPDVVPYVFERSLETVVVPLGGKLEQVRDQYLQILEKYTRVLVQHRIITGNCSTLTKGRIFMTMKDYQEKNRNGRDRSYSEIMRNLNICVTLYHAYELLIRHGLRGFLSFYEDHIDKPLLRGNVDLQNIMEDVRQYLGPTPNVEPLPDGTVADIPESSKFGHPKFYKLRDILSQHFTETASTASRVIVFCEYRESVMEAYALLLRHMPLIKPKIFLGQGAITQRQQINVIKAFKQGECNTLISTCIGEEGLDVGEVDLIVCFDINNKSPIRMVQRMGRTGRKREGRVIVLVTEGKEQQTLKDCLIHKQNLTNHILQSTALYKEMYPQNPRMVPEHLEPKCHKMFITVKTEGSRKKNNNLKDMFSNMLSNKLDIPFEDYDTDVLQINDKLPTKLERWNNRNPLDINCDKNRMDFSKKLNKLRILQPTGEIGHSRTSEMLVSLLQFSESKKYNIPMTQVPVMPSQKTSPKKVMLHNSEGLKQTDIRNMFFKASNSTGNPSQSKSQITDSQTSERKDDIKLDEEILNKLYTNISNYMIISDDIDCRMCENSFDCSMFIIPQKQFSVEAWTEPDRSIFGSLTVENLRFFSETISTKTELLVKLDDLQSTEVNSDPEMELQFAERRNTSYFDETFGYKNFPFEPPSSIKKVLKKLNLNDSAFDDMAFTQLEGPSSSKASLPLNVTKSKSCSNEIPCTFDINAFNDAEFTQTKTENNLNKTWKSSTANTHTTALNDVFDNSCVSMSPKASSSQDTIIYSPNGYKGSDTKNCSKQVSGSPILCSFDRVRQMKSKVHKRLFETSFQNESKAGQVQNMNTHEKSGIKHQNTEEPKNTSIDIFDESIAKQFLSNFKSMKPNLSRLHQNDEVKDTFYKSRKSKAVTVEVPIENDYNSAKEQDIKNNFEEEADDVIDTSLDDCFESIANSQIIKKDIKNNQETGNITGLSNIGNDVGSGTYQTIINNKISFGKEHQSTNVKAITKEIISRNKCLQNAQNAINNLHEVCDDSIFKLLFNNCCKDKEVPYTSPVRKKSHEIEENSKQKTDDDNLPKYKLALSAVSTTAVNDNILCNENQSTPNKTNLKLKNQNIASEMMCSINKSNEINQNQTKITQDARNYHTENNTKYKENDWQEDSVWDFCINWDTNKGNNQTANVEDNKNTNTKRNSPYKLLIKRDSRKCENDDIASDLELDEQNGAYVFMTPEKEKGCIEHENSPDVVDLTSPISCDLNKSPSLIKLQYTPLKSQQKKQTLSQCSLINYAVTTTNDDLNKIPVTSDGINEEKILQLTNKNTVKASSKTTTYSKLKLKKKDEPKSLTLTSMKWLKKNISSSQTNSTLSIGSQQPTTSGSISNKLVSSSKCDKDIHNEISLTKGASVSSNRGVPKTDNNNTTSKKSVKVDIDSINLNSSDDDFELPLKKSSGWIKTNSKTTTQIRKLAVVKQSEINSTSNKKPNENKSSGANVKKKQDQCPYIDLEAEVSSDENKELDSDIEEVNDDRFEESFVDDDTQNIGNTTVMHAKYLQSTRSPLLNRGKFKIPQKQRVPTNVYSQLVDESENTYVNDTFCVYTEDMKFSPETQNISELELAELILEQERKNKKKKRKKLDNLPKSKRRRIIDISSDSE